LPDGNRYESTLERDLMLLLQFERRVAKFYPQPLTLTFNDAQGSPRKYTPDGLVEWLPDAAGVTLPPLLVEVKYREAFVNDWRMWRMRARAAQVYARERGWTFEIHTERDIRTVALDNARMLLPFNRGPRDTASEALLLTTLAAATRCSPAELISRVSAIPLERAALLPSLWRLLCEHRIGFDRHVRVTMASDLWSV
jgi:hypothetical protein